MQCKSEAPEVNWYRTGLLSGRFQKFITSKTTEHGRQIKCIFQDTERTRRAPSLHVDILII